MPNPLIGTYWPYVGALQEEGVPPTGVPPLSETWPEQKQPAGTKSIPRVVCVGKKTTRLVFHLPEGTDVALPKGWADAGAEPGTRVFEQTEQYTIEGTAGTTNHISGEEPSPGLQVSLIAIKDDMSVSKETRSLAALRTISTPNPRAVLVTCSEGGVAEPFHLVFEWHYQAPKMEPPKCEAKFTLNVKVSWEGEPPEGVRFGAADGTDPYDPKAPVKERLRGSDQRVPGPVAKRGAIVLTFHLESEREGKHSIHVQAARGFPPAPVDFRAGGWQIPPGQGASFGPNGTLDVEVDLQCKKHRTKTVELNYAAPAEPGGGGGGPPPQKPEKPGQRPPKAAKAGALGAQARGYPGGYVGPGVPYASGVEEFAGPAAWASGIDRALFDLDARGSADFDPAEGLMGTFEPDRIGGLSPVASQPTGPRVGAPWTQLDIVVDPNASQDAREAVDLHDIQGQQIVRGVFDGRFRGFVSGP